MHTVPHAPQWLVSLAVSTQEAPQVVFAPHSVVHLPASQTWFAPQALPHVPQFFSSEDSFTHCSAHFE